MYPQGIPDRMRLRSPMARGGVGFAALVGAAAIVLTASASGADPASADAARQHRVVSTDQAPAAIGPYSQGVLTGRTLYVSGQLPMEPQSGEIVGADIGVQTERSLRNVQAVVEAAGMSLDDVVSTTVYLHDLDDFAAFNQAYAEFFDSPAPPARATVQVARIPRDALVEVAAIAVR